MYYNDRYERFSVELIREKINADYSFDYIGISKMKKTVFREFRRNGGFPYEICFVIEGDWEKVADEPVLDIQKMYFVCRAGSNVLKRLAKDYLDSKFEICYGDLDKNVQDFVIQDTYDDAIKSFEGWADAINMQLLMEINARKMVAEKKVKNVNDDLVDFMICFNKIEPRESKEKFTPFTIIGR